MESPVVLVVGAASRDIVDDDPRGWRLGGAVTFASLALARLGFTVRALVGADREAATAHELELVRAAGVQLAVADLASGPVFDNVRHILHATSDPVRLTHLPRLWMTGFDAVLLVPVAGEVGDEWAAMGGDAGGPPIALGWQGLLRTLAAGAVIEKAPPVRTALVAAATLISSSRDDFEPGTDPVAVAELLSPAASLVVTAAERGGQVLTRGENGAVLTSRYPAITSDTVIDPTGAGDVFLATMLAASLVPSLGVATTVAAAAASLTVEGPGLFGVPDLAAVRERMTRAPSRANLRPRAVSTRTSGRPSQA
jgi:hypothetical protein